MGHTLGDVKNAYDDLDPEFLKKKYMKLLPFLSIRKELPFPNTS
ncbi:hypothetical protein V7O67_10660 [Methanolobus sp. ZRKC4]